MGWADKYIERIQKDGVVKFRPVGRSMEPVIYSGDLVTVECIGNKIIEIGDILLCKVGKRQYLHMVKSTDNEKYLIGNMRRNINGYADEVYGVLIKINDKRLE